MAALRPLPRLRLIMPAPRPSLECSFRKSCYRPPERPDRTIGSRLFEIMAGRISCPGRGAAFFMPLRRAGTVPNTGVCYGPGSAAHRSARATRCAASGARWFYDAIFGRLIGCPSACSTRSKVSIRTRMLDSRPALNCAKCASRRLIGLLESMRGEGIADHRCRRIHPEHDGFPVEAVDADVVGDLPAYLQHGGLAAAAAQERKHVDRPVDRPFDVLVDQRLEVLAAGVR